MKKEIKPPADILKTIERGIDIPNRVIYFGDTGSANDASIKFNNVELVIRAIDYMLSEDSNKPIIFNMSSPGGSIYDLLNLVDKILESPCPFIFYGRGMIMSAATIIMAVCDLRYLSKNTTIMCHEVSSFIGWGKTGDQEIDLQESKRLQEILEQLYATNSIMPAVFWKALCRKDTYLTAEETISLGLADEIVAYPDRTKFRAIRRGKHSGKTPESNKQLIQVLSERTGTHISLDKSKTKKKD